MVSIISFILGLIILGILYKNMIAWEGDYRISGGQALLPVLLGLSSVPLSFIFFLIIGLVFRAVTGFVPTETDFQFFIVRTMLCGAVCFFLYQISGDKTLASCYVSTGYVIKNSIGFLVMSLIMGSVLLLSNIDDKVPLKDNPVLGFIIIFLMFISVGLFDKKKITAHSLGRPSRSDFVQS